MGSFTDQTRRAIDMFAGRDFGALRLAITRRIRRFSRLVYSNSEYVILRRDLTQDFEAPGAKIEFELRPRPAGELLELGFVLSREEHHIGTWYAAHTSDDEVCFIQWVGSKQDADYLRSHTPVVPQLESRDVLFDGAFTPDGHRRQGMLSAGLAGVAAIAARDGAQTGFMIVARHNQPSLRGSANAGFSETASVTVEQRWFRRRLKWTGTP